MATVRIMVKNQHFINEVVKLRNKSYVDKKIIKQFIKRVHSGSLTKKENEFDHLCSFFLPVHKPTRQIFLGHHIKAQDWIPPGGHINLGETPIDTVRREFIEELSHKLTNEQVELFDLSTKDVSGNPRHKCKIHYDFWHIVYTDKIPFVFDKGEFYDAGWFTFDEALKKTKLKQYNKIIRKIKAYI